MRQYEVGERFVNGVVELGGFGAVDAVWTAPEYLPSLDELDDPPAWYARVQPGRRAG
jgi:uncharacterized protein (DUF2342 family)